MDEDGEGDLVPGFGLVAEDEFAAKIASGLADRVFCNDVDWIAKDNIDHVRRWRGLDYDPGWLRLHDVYKQARNQGLAVHGHFDGRPGGPDARSVRAALLLFNDPRLRKARPDAVVIMRDLDGDPERADGIRQAVAAHEWPFEVVLALAQPEAEAWIVAGFIPENEAERQRIERVRQELGFDPTTHPDKLTSTGRGNIKDAKRVRAALTSGDEERETRCSDALVGLEGTACGVDRYVGETRERIVPIFRRTS